MKAMVLAAGFGTRLKELTQNTPKPLLKVHDRPLIGYALHMLRMAGISEVVINLHHLGGLIKDELGEGRKFGLKISYSEEPEILGTGGGLKKAESLIGDSRFILVNSDIICDIDLQQVIQFHEAQRCLATMVVREDRRAVNFDEIKLDSEFNVLSINDLPQKHLHAIPRMFTGIHLMEPEVFGFLQPTFSSIISGFYQRAIESGRRVKGYDFSGFWCDAGTPESLRQVQKTDLPATFDRMFNHEI